ncbi:hypothetical protein BOX15_Mlig023546g1 [Macrostomum lignano]|uniref:Uncharacterized protein n=1 Tax=Macrostomum lignano TaxID=282301 RepID=A0A267GB12_9PLAT|nr:hypothetical protein BOX15_Mlig023546g1 [Macrostomum lignano]
MSDLGQHYRRLRAFRPLLFQSAHHVANNPSIGEALPASLVAHLLFSRAPVDMQSPHTAAGWSVSRYVSWLLDYPEESDRLRFIQGTLVAYAKSAQARGVREYAAVYPVLLTLVNAHLNAASSTDEEANVETEVSAGEGF